MFNTIFSSVATSLSLNVILFFNVAWLQDVNNGFKDIGSTLLTLAGIVLTYFTILHVREQYRGKRLDNTIKKIELKELKDQTNEKD